MSLSKASIKFDQMSSSVQVSDVRLSLDGGMIGYIIQPICKEDHKFSSPKPSSLWITNIAHPQRDRRVTSENEIPSSPSFHPNGESLLYLSSSHPPGGPSQIHSLNLSGNSEPTLLGKESPQSITLFSVSPNGEFVAFTSAEDGYRDEGSFCERIRIRSFTTGEEVAASPPSERYHVNGFVWAPDSQQLLFYTWPANRPECRESSMPHNQSTIGVYILGANGLNLTRCIGHLNQSPGPWERQSFLWPSPNDIVNISKYDPNFRPMDGMATHWYSLDSFGSTLRGGGEIDSPNSLIDLRFDGMIAVLIERGTSTAIEIWKRGKRVKALLELQDSAISTSSLSWDVKRMHDGSFKIAMIKSSGMRGLPEEIWLSFCDSHGNITFDEPLTRLNRGLGTLDIRSSLLEWENTGIKIQGMVTYPPSHSPGSPHLPTVLLIHSGPYSRTTPDFKLDKFRLQLFLASHGYLVLSPNYRGSSGRGSAFTRISGSRLITESWSDCDSMVHHAVSLGMADPSRLALAGHSSGGYLAALGASVTKNRYKSCITWSGPSDLTALAGISQTPEFQFSMSGLAPWSAEPADLLRDVGGRMVHPSPVRNLEGVETTFLILHGKEDLQVPASQATVLLRGLRRLSRFPARHEMVVYDREGHVFEEMGHLNHALEKVLHHLQKYLRYTGEG